MGELIFRTRYKGHAITATSNRPMTTRFTLMVDSTVLAESSRPALTDHIAAMKTWFGMKPVWEISGVAELDGQSKRISAKHYTTFTTQYVEIFVDGVLVGPEVQAAVSPETRLSN